MRLSPVFVVLVTAAGLVACSKFTIAPPNASPSPFVPKPIWSGTSAGFQITWTTADIIAATTGAQPHEAFSEVGRTIADFHAVTRGQTSDCDMTRQADLQSVVGPILSIRTTDTMKCANGSVGAGRSTMAIDLTHPQRTLSLADLFPVHELDALTVKAEHFCPSVPKDLLSRFAFSELHRQTVIVAVTLPPGCSTAEVDLALNVPVALAKPLQMAARRTQGFLLHDQPAVSGGLSTTVNYHYRMAVQ